MQPRHLLPRRLLAIAVAGLGFAGCQHPPGRTTAATGPRVFAVRGVLQELKDDGRVAVIRHENIPGYMAAMTMPFDVRDPAGSAVLHPGDTVSFRLNVTETDGWIDQLKLLKPGQPVEAGPKVESIRVARIVDELKEGDRMPEYRFTNELRQATTLNQFHGQAVGLTFIYTRCPYPTFCPRQSRNFAEACERLKSTPGAPSNWHLLSLSFDPEHDTPAVLRDYAREHQADAKRWNFLTGPISEIDAITEQFGLFFARDGSGFSHNVRTVVIDATGRIQRIFTGNQWTAEELAAELTRAAQAH